MELRDAESGDVTQLAMMSWLRSPSLTRLPDKSRTGHSSADHHPHAQPSYVLPIFAVLQEHSLSSWRIIPPSREHHLQGLGMEYFRINPLVSPFRVLIACSHYRLENIRIIYPRPFFTPFEASTSTLQHSNMATAQDKNIEVDPAVLEDQEEEGYASSGYDTSTASLSSSVNEYVFENGRRYHTYFGVDKNPMPTDQVNTDSSTIIGLVLNAAVG